jgi:hypothetical protein
LNKTILMCGAGGYGPPDRNKTIQFSELQATQACIKKLSSGMRMWGSSESGTPVAPGCIQHRLVTVGPVSNETIMIASTKAIDWAMLTPPLIHLARRYDV